MITTLYRLVAVAVLLAACGSDGDRPTSAGAPADGDEPSPVDPVVDEPSPVDPGFDGSPAAASASLFRDLETGSLWNLRGEAVQGPLAGARLDQLPAHSAYWFAWSSFWPHTAVWGDDGAGDGAFHEGAFAEIPRTEYFPDVPIDAIPPLDDPPAGLGHARFVVADAAQLHDTDLVVGVHIDGDARAYPTGILNFHEIVNHTVGGRRVVLTYCPLTASGILFEATYEFGNTGGLFNNNMVMYDRDTQSFWGQMAVSAILGDEAGRRLTMLPVYQGTWGAWRDLFPDTEVLPPDTGYGGRSYERDIYVERGYNRSREVWFPQVPAIDPRFHPKDMTLGLVGERGTRAYVFSKLQDLGRVAAVNDEFEGLPVVVVYHGEGQMAVPFSRHLSSDDGARTLSFEAIR